MTPTIFTGVLPAITTPFTSAGELDLEFFERHVRWLLDHGCTGIVVAGSLGEGATLSDGERGVLLKTAVAASAGRAPVIASIAAASTRGAVAQAEQARSAGCRGLMVLPPYVYRGYGPDSWPEMRGHVSAVIEATDLECMLYNNPIAYGVDFNPEQIAELAASHSNLPNLRAVKESSGDVRRITAIRARCGDSLAVLVGVDDLIVEGIDAGATGWIAGLVNALPSESVTLFSLAMRGSTAPERAEALRLYSWFLPLLRMDVVPEFVHLIKLVQEAVGIGSARVRAPRQPLSGQARTTATLAIRAALSSRPASST